ncbi:MAG: hypothetical protein HYZ12_04010 [Thaumarchaeota archaeon]|nr:hypothetical protein [Nitrososphaerota archaeon]
MLSGVGSIKAVHLCRSSNQFIPLTEISFLGANNLSEMVGIVKRLRAGKPPLYLDESRMDEMILQVNPMNLEDKDLGIIAERIREATE